MRATYRSHCSQFSIWRINKPFCCSTQYISTITLFSVTTSRRLFLFESCSQPLCAFVSMKSLEFAMCHFSRTFFSIASSDFYRNDILFYYFDDLCKIWIYGWNHTTFFLALYLCVRIFLGATALLEVDIEISITNFDSKRKKKKRKSK